MTRKTVRIAMNGVTGRMGYRQHLVRSILALREQGGLDLGDGTVLWPEPILVGRREHALREIAERHGLARWSTDLDTVLSDPSVDIYFDAQVTVAQPQLDTPTPIGNLQYTAPTDPSEAPSNMAEAARAQAAAEGLEAPPEAVEEVVNTPVVKSDWDKTPRNAPCPCGSGKKFKLCHGQ